MLQSVFWGGGGGALSQQSCVSFTLRRPAHQHLDAESWSPWRLRLQPERGGALAEQEGRQPGNNPDAVL